MIPKCRYTTKDPSTLWRYILCRRSRENHRWSDLNDRLKYSFHRSWFESGRIWATALVVGENCEKPSHWQQTKTLSQWMKEQNVPGISNVDTRALTKIIREKGTILGRIIMGKPPSNVPPLISPPIKDPNERNLVAEVSFAGITKVRVSTFPFVPCTTPGRYLPIYSVLLSFHVFLSIFFFFF